MLYFTPSGILQSTFVRNKQNPSYKLEAANYHALKVLLNVGEDVDYNSILLIAGMKSLEFRRYEQSLSLL